MSAQAMQEDQLLDLLLQLKKTTPDQARMILNAQPQIAYALMAVMVNVNVVNMDVVQKILASYSTVPSSSTQPPPASISAPAPAVAPAPAIPPHLSHQPPHRSVTPTYPSQPQHTGYPGPAYAQHQPGPQNPYGAPPPPNAPGPSYGMQAPPPAALPASLPPALVNIPDDQKALIMRVISMTREEIYQLPYNERDNIIKLRATLGLPT
ncbi:hypothetical protein CERSUDRAFT_110724 [Gelatoporia subvermispora B]|uniref:Cleavage stimulation factor subunit 2 hinge domain-containing protein n=1 Tax=Ceriporiopsis subvermispora (strain B) TaxID=914234 RepID=M2RTB4_CERS8|nr:hypothetical protein CERSUDRAFT_110724 [Gelatoporia subvermispora B]